MTALDRYAKLEAVGRYRDGDSDGGSDEPREVVVSFGKRSLIIMGLDDAPIAHWPLASLRATGDPARLPVEIAPDRVGDERLLLDDREMSAAIAEVCPDLYTAPAPPARRRPWRAVVTVLALAALALAVLVLWPRLPDSLADLVPPEREAALGRALATRLPALLEPGAPPALCTGEDGVAALHTLAARLGAGVTGPPLRLSVLDHPARDALSLPGGHLLLFRGLVEATRSPEALAGIVAHAIGHEAARDPLRAVLDRAGFSALPGLLVGDITAGEVVRDAGTALVATDYPQAAETGADRRAFAVLAASGLPTLPYSALNERLATAGPSARYLDRHPWSLARARAAAEADTVGGMPFVPALRDRDWIALGTICERTRPAGRARF